MRSGTTLVLGPGGRYEQNRGLTRTQHVLRSTKSFVLYYPARSSMTVEPHIKQYLVRIILSRKSVDNTRSANNYEWGTSGTTKRRRGTPHDILLVLRTVPVAMFRLAPSTENGQALCLFQT